MTSRARCSPARSKSGTAFSEKVWRWLKAVPRRRRPDGHPRRHRRAWTRPSPAAPWSWWICRLDSRCRAGGADDPARHPSCAAILAIVHPLAAQAGDESRCRTSSPEPRIGAVGTSHDGARHPTSGRAPARHRPPPVPVVVHGQPRVRAVDQEQPAGQAPRQSPVRRLLARLRPSRCASRAAATARRTQTERTPARVTWG